MTHAPSDARPGHTMARRRLFAVLYAGYAAGVSLVVATLFWPVIMLVPSTRTWRYRAARLGGSFIKRLVGVQVVVNGTVPGDGPVVVVANHLSFVDGLVLILAIDEPLTFVVGAAFARMAVVGRFLERLGCIFVGTGSTREALVVTDRLEAALRAGQSVASFPEGGLAETPALRNFRLGPFRAAVDAGVPVVPVAIRGSFEVLSPGWPPVARPGRIVVTVGTPLHATGTGWRAHVALRRAARDAVVAMLAEMGSTERPRD